MRSSASKTANKEKKPVASSLLSTSPTNIVVTFLQDQYGCIYSSCKGLFLGIKNNLLELTAPANTIVFKSLNRLIANNTPIVLKAMPKIEVDDYIKSTHYDFWGVIPTGINPINNKAVKLEDYKISDQTTHQSIQNTFYINEYHRRITNTLNQPVILTRAVPEIIPSLVLVETINIDLNNIPELNIKPIIEIPKDTNIMSTIQELVTSLNAVQQGLASLAIVALELELEPKKSLLEKTVSIIQGTQEYVFDFTDLTKSVLVSNKQAESLAKGLRNLSKNVLIPLHQKANEGVLGLSNIKMNLDLNTVIGNCRTLADTLNSSCENTSTTFQKTLQGYIRNLSNCVSFELQQLLLTPLVVNKDSHYLAKDICLNIKSAINIIREDLKTIRLNTSLRGC